MQDDSLEGLDPKQLLGAALGAGGVDGTERELQSEEEREVRKLIRQHLPDLELLGLLGRGGMGYVFEVRQMKLERVVALKVLVPRSPSDGGLAQRFLREAQALAKLAHPNIVAVYDFGQEGDFCWLMMERIDGTSLRQVLQAGELQPSEALAMVPKLCDALQFAHEQGVVHRDVKPENILIDKKGSVKIVDFGLAKLVGEEAALVSLTGTQQVLGTLRYMAPEQLDRPESVDHRADIYSLGVVFYEMLTGQIPMGRFALPSKSAHTDPRLDEVVLRTLEREPEERYQQISDVRHELDAIRRGESAADAEPKNSMNSKPGAEWRAASPRLSNRALWSVLCFAAVWILSLWGLGRMGNADGEVAEKMEQTQRGRAESNELEAMRRELPEFLELSLADGSTKQVLNPEHAMLTSRFESNQASLKELVLELEADKQSKFGVLALLPLLVILSWISCALGWRALASIKREHPALYGVNLAIIGAWWLPVLCSGGLFVWGLRLLMAQAVSVETFQVRPPILVYLFAAGVFLWNWRKKYLSQLEQS